MKGKVLINRNYRGDVDNSMIDKFIGYVECATAKYLYFTVTAIGSIHNLKFDFLYYSLVSEKDEDGSLTPLICTPECTYAFIKHSNLYVVATTKKNSNIAMIFVLLHKICAVSSNLYDSSKEEAKM